MELEFSYNDEYNTVIEVKCTRDSMSERNITEEIGSDAFHYQPGNLFFFIYDKESILRNIDAFVNAYTGRSFTEKRWNSRRKLVISLLTNLWMVIT